jgi:hypothetical protein
MTLTTTGCIILTNALRVHIYTAPHHTTTQSDASDEIEYGDDSYPTVPPQRTLSEASSSNGGEKTPASSSGGNSVRGRPKRLDR